MCSLLCFSKNVLRLLQCIHAEISVYVFFVLYKKHREIPIVQTYSCHFLSCVRIIMGPTYKNHDTKLGARAQYRKLAERYCKQI